ncbi:MAG: leucine-rich repeat domain-containing protein [Candidatus Azobacteroides sp.]|nr:leucine-rich repeat domain-containing protein [Candidatus Azobacteroides sp.]
MKKAFITIVWALFFISLHAQDAIVDGMHFKIRSMHVVELTDVENKEELTHLSIPDRITIDGNSYEVSSLAEKLFFDCTKLQTVKLPAYIGKIGNFTFYNCTALTAIDIPQYVTSIGVSSFYNCINLKSVNIPNRVTSIGTTAFYNCISLTSIDIPDRVTLIENSAFMNCESIQSVILPELITVVSSSVFEGCTNLTSVELSGSVTTIQSCAFKMCKNLSEITFPSTLKVLGYEVFFGSKLKSIYLPASVEGIDPSAFDSCLYVTSFNVEAENPIYSSVDGVLYNKQQTKLISYPVAHERETFTVPNSVEIIESTAFCFSTNLKSVNFPSTLISIGHRAFSDCIRLDAIDLPLSLETIGNFAFANTNLTAVEIHPTIRSIGTGAFNCPNLEFINVADENTFYSSIDGVLFNKRQTRIMQYPAAGKNKEYMIPATVESITQRSFYNNKNLVSIVLPTSVTSIEESAFLRCSSLDNIKVLWEEPILLRFPICDSEDQYTLIVPSGTKELYQQADYWKDFKEIIETEPTYLKELSNKNIKVIISGKQLHVDTPVDETISIYTIDGVELSSFHKTFGPVNYPLPENLFNILIIKGSSGWTKKIAE